MTSYRKKYDDSKHALLKKFDELLELEKSVKVDFGDQINIEDEISNINELKKKFENRTFEIVVVGEFSTGKSTFINALMKKNVLPSKATPTTATINYMKHVEENNGVEEAKVYMNNGEVITVKHDEIASFTMEQSKEHNVSETVNHIDIFIDSDYLKGGVVIVDTPGLSSLNAEHKEITYRKMKTAQASIILISGEQAGKDSEFNFLNDLKKYIDRMFFVVNRIDTVNPSEVEEVISDLRKNLVNNPMTKLNESQVEIYPVSALQALKAYDSSLDTHLIWKESDPEQLMSTSRFPEFENRLEQYLFDGEKINDEIESSFKAVSSNYQILQEKITDIENTISENDIESIKREYNNLKHEVLKKEKALKKETYEITNEIEEVKDKNVITLKNNLMDETNMLSKTIDSAEDANELDEFTQDEVEEYTHKISRYFDDQLREYTRTVQKVLKKKYDELEYKIKFPDMDLNILKKEISVSDIEIDTRFLSEQDEQRIESDRAKLKEEQENLKTLMKIRKGRQLLENDLKYQREIEEQNNAFYESLYARVEPKIKEEIRVGFFRRKKVVEKENEEYKRIQQEKESRHQNAQNLNREMMAKIQEQRMKEIEAEAYVSYSDLNGISEASKNISKLERELIDKGKKAAEKKYAKALEREKRKVKREIDGLRRDYFKHYEEVLDGLNTLEFVQAKIDEYIQKENDDLNKKRGEMEAQKAMLESEEGKKKNTLELASKYTEIIQDKQIDLEGM